MKDVSDRRSIARKGWKYTNIFAWCPLHKMIVRLVKVNWLYSWKRCEFCLVKIL